MRKPTLVAAIAVLTVITVLASGPLPANAAPVGPQLVGGPASTDLNYGSASMAYDPDTSQLLLYGGSRAWGDSCTCDSSRDVRVWDGTNWRLLIELDQDAEWMHLVYDAATHQMLSFGGTSHDSQAPAGMIMSAWDGQAWITLPQAQRPAGLYADSAAYDPATGQLIWFGGVDFLGTFHNDTWTWDGTSWTKLQPRTSPSARDNAFVGYDDATRQFVLAGGQDAAGTQLRDTWIWTGTTWKQRTGALSPVHIAAGTFDPALNSLIVIADASTGTGRDVWKWTGSAWVELTTAALPSDVRWAAAAWDAATGQLVVVTEYGISARPAVPAANWVLAAPTTTKLTASPAPAHAGQPVQVTAAVNATTYAVTGGRVTFTDKNVQVPGCVGVLVTSGAAGCTLTPGAGSHTLRARFSPGPGYLASTSANLVLNVTT